MTWTVTRQCQWPDGNNVVEVSAGGIDYTNPDALSAKFAGEFETFAAPREAAEVAIRICQEWRKVHKGRRPAVGVGGTGGMTMPFDPTTFRDLRRWAKAAYGALEKCPGCGGIMGGEKWRADDWSGQEFCSERCTEKEA